MTTYATHAHSAFLLAAFLLPAFAGACSNDSDEPEDERPPPVGVNRPPIVQGERTANTDEDVPIVVSLLDGVTDPDGDPLTVSELQIDAAATLKELGSGKVEVTPALNSSEKIKLTYSVSDGKARASSSYVIDVRAINDHPVARGASFRNRGRFSFVLETSDVEQQPLSYEIVEPPTHGQITGVPPALSYTPEAGYVGPDRLTFRVSDGLDSSPLTVVDFDVHLGARPVAAPQSISLWEDSSFSMQLSGSDADRDLLTFSVVTAPTHGTLIGSPPSLRYVPNANYYGSDSFAFVVMDEYQTSEPAIVDVTIAASNDWPVAAPISTTVEEDGTVAITLQGSDAEGAPLTFSLASSPAHGVLLGTSPFLTYRPLGNYHGSDSFSYRVSDGTLSSATAAVSITVVPMPDPPFIPRWNVWVMEDVVTRFHLSTHDPDGDPVTFEIVTPPALGTLTGTPPILDYAPPLDYSGVQTFTYNHIVGGDTVLVTMTLDIGAINDSPVAEDMSVNLLEDMSVAITARATDVDGPELIYSIASPPSDGTLTHLGGASFSYTPAPNINGTRSFMYRVRDGVGGVDFGTVTLAIAPVNDAPIAVDDGVLVAQAAPISLEVLDNDSDLEGDVLEVANVSPPAHGTVELEGDTLVYTPAAGFVGVESLTYTVADAHGATATATAHFGVGTVPPGMPRETIAIAGADLQHGFRAPSLSDDGRVIAFASRLALVPEDNNGHFDIYVYDRVSRQLTCITTALGGGQSNANSSTPRVSGNGRYVVFESAANNLVAGDTNGQVDVFRHDLVTDETLRVSVSTSGIQGSNRSAAPQISDDGNLVVFESRAFELVPNDANGTSDIFLRDVAAGTTTRVSVSTTGGDADGESLEAAISGNGQLVAFTSRAGNLVAGDGNARSDVFLRDVAAGTTTRVSVSSAGVEGDEDSLSASLSDDGRFISFRSFATNLTSTPNHSVVQVLMRDRQALTTIATSAIGAGSLSDDGRYLTEYNSTAPWGDTARVIDRFAPSARALYGPNGAMAHPVLSGNGRYIVALNDFDGAVIVTPNPL